MTITSKRKLTSGVAILCAFMILIGIFPVNLFTVRNAEAAGTEIYTYSKLYFDITNVADLDVWKDKEIKFYAIGWSTDNTMTKIDGTNVYYADLSGWTNLGGSGEIYFHTSDNSARTTNLGNLGYIFQGSIVGDTTCNNVFVCSTTIYNSEYGCDRTNKNGQEVERAAIPSLAGKLINFKDMTGTLNAENITAVFTGDGISGDPTNLNNGQVTVPADTADGKSYTTVEFKNGTTSLGKYNLFNESSTGVEGVSYDENTCNTFYYGATEKADGTKLSYWGAPLVGAEISNKKLYLDNSKFPVGSGNAPQIKIGNTTNSFIADSEDDSIYSYTVSSVSSNDIVSVIYNDNTYHFIWSNNQNDMVSLQNDIAVVSSAHLKVEPNTIYFDATLSKLKYGSGASNPDAAIPRDTDATVWCHLFKGGSTKDVKMERVDTNPNSKWYDVYKAKVDDAANYSNVIFVGGSEFAPTWNNGGNSSQTSSLTLPDFSSDNVCFYADTGDDSAHENQNRSGYWGKPFQVRDAESGKENKDVVKITNSNFADDKDSEALYINSTFYDYYSDYELNGNNRKDYGGSNGGSQRNWVIFRQFDQALSDYYKSNGVSVNDAIYTGQFQPSIDGWGTRFSDVAGTLNLYGYSNYNTFFSNNNSSIDIDNSGDKYSHITQNIVNHKLKDSTPQTFDGKALSPYFNEDFLMGNNSKNTKLGEIYKNVAFPFTKEDVNGVEYWTFDSSKTTLAMRQESGTSNYHLKNVGNQAWAQNVNSSGTTEGDKVSTTYGFFPFNENTTAISGKNYNYGFGTKFEFKFRLTKDGTVKDSGVNNVPIKFEFSGDDDVWVFVDNQLVLDVGGDHGKATGTIDFANLTSTVSYIKKSANNKDGTNQASIASVINVENRTDEHTLTMFYMERGMWESNMRVQFNFPDENQLQVEKQVDTTNVDNMFKGFFRDEAMQFTFDIKNFATHYAELAASTGKQEDPINVLEQSHTLSSTSSANIFRKSSQTIGDRSETIHWWAKSNNDNPYRGWTQQRLGEITFAKLVNISQMQYLSFDMYMQDKSIETGNIYIQLKDASGKISYAFLTSDKLYGTPARTPNTWSTFRVILNRLTSESGFDNTQIKSIGFQYDIESNIYLDNFVFQPIVQGSESTGFVKDQRLIPSYGSVTSQKLEKATGAEYKSSITENGTRKVDDNGQFILQSGEIVSFYDQFRRGSYIYLNENLTNAQKLLFDTKYTMYEDDVPVTSFSTSGSSTVSGNSKNLTDVNCTNRVGEGNVTVNAAVDDGRTEKRGTSDEQEENNYNGTKPSDSTFVFRSYSNPDAVKASTKLKVLYTNTVKTSSLTIKKEEAKINNESHLKGKYKFYVEFTNIGGVSLTDANGNSRVIDGPYELEIGESKTITGIPVGTKYKIHEVVSRQTEGATTAVPDAILGFVSQTAPTEQDKVPFSYDSLNTTDGDFNTWSVEGQVSYNATAFSYQFNNMYMPVISLNVEKIWSIPDGVTVTLPDMIQLKLQRYNNETSNWEDVPNRDVITLSESNEWKIDINDLNEFVDTSKFTFDESGNVNTSQAEKWKYRIVELDSNNNIIEDGGSFNENFTTRYGKNDGTSTDKDILKITNTYTQKCSIRITKVDAVENTKKLKGAKFGIYDKDPNTDTSAKLISTVTTGDDGIAVFKDLEKKTYYIKEITAPPGYQISNQVHEIDLSTLSDGNFIHNIQIDNKPITMPEAGGEGKNNPFNFVLFGAIAIALAGGILLLNKKYAFLHIGKSSKEVQ